jgi:hypothetical protein
VKDFNNTLFVFTTTPAGLGHIRVMDAIKSGMPMHATTIDLGILDIKANRIHDLGSRVKPFVKLTEFYQTNPIAESLVTSFYTNYLKRHTQKIIEDFDVIAKDHPNLKNWVVISTHFALAHSIASAKETLEKKLGIKIHLCVIVTDDSPQKVWAIEGADLIFVPSQETKTKLSNYLSAQKKEILKAIPFPVAPRLTQALSASEFEFVINQLNPVNPNSHTQIEIPISGAAVQLDFFKKFIGILCRDNYEFTVIGQESLLTKMFFENIQKLPRVQLSIGLDPWQTVKFYESIFYQPNRPSIEITKPSEQAFKALLNPRQRGGVILLLTTPIGRQEFDNLNFLIRNGLMPSEEENKQMFNDADLKNWLVKARNWRAIRLPEKADDAASFVQKIKTSGVLYSMLNAVIPPKAELQDNGVMRIWEEIGKILI